MKSYLSKELLQSVRSYNDLVKVAGKLASSIKSCSAENSKLAKFVAKSSDDSETFKVTPVGKGPSEILDFNELPHDKKGALTKSSSMIRDLTSHIDTLKSLRLMAEYYSSLKTYDAFVSSLNDLIEEAEEQIKTAKKHLKTIASDSVPKVANNFANKVGKVLFGEDGVIPSDFYEGKPKAAMYVLTQSSEDSEHPTYLYQFIMTAEHFKSMVGVDDSSVHVYPYFSVVATTKMEPVKGDDDSDYYKASYYIQVLANKLEPGHFEIGTLVNPKNVKSLLEKLIAAYNSSILVSDNRETIPGVGDNARKVLALTKLKAVKSVSIEDDKVVVQCVANVTHDQQMNIKKNIFSIVKAYWPEGSTPSISGPDEDNKIEFFITMGAKVKKPQIDRQTLLDIRDALGLEPQEMQQLKVMILGAAHKRS